MLFSYLCAVTILSCFFLSPSSFESAAAVLVQNILTKISCFIIKKTLAFYQKNHTIKLSKMNLKRADEQPIRLY